MKVQLTSIFRKSVWLLAAQLSGKIISFFYNIFLAQNLGVSGYGFYIVALSYFSLTSSIADFGINRFLTREISQDHKNVERLVLSTIILRVVSLLLIFVIFAVGIEIFDKNSLRASLTTLAVVAVIPQGISLTLDALLIALLKVGTSSFGIFLMSIVTSLIGVVLVSLGIGPLGALVALVLGQIIYAVFLLVVVLRQKISVLGKVDTLTFKKIIVESLPYGILAVMGLLYFKLDALILSYLQGVEAAGTYGLAYKFLESIIFLPSTLSVVIFPIMAKLQTENFANLIKIYPKIIAVTFFAGIIVAVGFILVLPSVITQFLPNFIPAIALVKILSLAIPFIFVHVVAASVVLSSKKYLKGVLVISTIPLLFNIVANLIFIPQYSYLAASWITVISDIISFALILAFINNIFRNYDQKTA